MITPKSLRLLLPQHNRICLNFSLVWVSRNWVRTTHRQTLPFRVAVACTGNPVVGRYWYLSMPIVVIQQRPLLLWDATTCPPIASELVSSQANCRSDYHRNRSTTNQSSSREISMPTFLFSWKVFRATRQTVFSAAEGHRVFFLGAYRRRGLAAI